MDLCIFLKEDTQKTFLKVQPKNRLPKIKRPYNLSGLKARVAEDIIEDQSSCHWSVLEYYQKPIFSQQLTNIYCQIIKEGECWLLSGIY